MLGQVIATSAFSGSGIAIGLFRFFMQMRESKKKQEELAREREQQRRHEERLAHIGGLKEILKQNTMFQAVEMHVPLQQGWAIEFWKLKLERIKETSGTITKIIRPRWAIPATQVVPSIMLLMFCVTICYSVCICFEDATTALYVFSPENAREHWSVFWGFATWEESNPTVVKVTKGAIAFWLCQPINTAILSEITGRYLRGRG